MIAGLTAYQVALTDGTVTQDEWIAVAIAVATVLGGVYLTANTTKERSSAAPATEEVIPTSPAAEDVPVIEPAVQ